MEQYKLFPLMWFSFFLMGKDLEMSCDENVLKIFGDETRTNYSHSLLALATGKRQLISGSPLAFGESNAKARIKNVLNYKKPPFWVVVAALIATLALVVLFTANPKNNMISQVSILTDKESLAFDPLKSSFQGFNLTPDFKNGITTDPVQYRWSVTEGDFIIKGDPSKEVVNSGESLLWSSTLIGWSKWTGSSSTYDIKLKVEDVKTSKVLAETTLTIERNDQVFKVNTLNKYTSIKLNNENVDDVSIYYGFSSYAMFGADDDTLKGLSNQFNNLSFEPTDKKMDTSTMLNINFHQNKKTIASVNVDENGVFWLDGETKCYKVSSGSFDYEYVKNIYLKSKK